ncbi:hypothetical protein Lepto7375DRAFT_6525 [Leptolyngbya sp. PCC 7375]|nr:hypothetical protein Lepto7375DRAFT_6525 [Leptolyngbya sp. PCC 7375]
MLDKLLGKKSGYYLELPAEEIAAISEPAATPAPAATPVPAATPAPAAVQSKAPTAETVKKKDSKASEPTAPAVTPAASISDPIELIRTALAASANQPPAPEPEPAPTFDYTTPVAKASRRRPGPSMSSFKSMAKAMRRTTAGF